MTEDTNIIDTTAQVLDTPESTPVTTPTPLPLEEGDAVVTDDVAAMERDQPKSTDDQGRLRIDVIFGEMYEPLKQSVMQFIADLCKAGMNAEQAVAHGYEHAKMLVHHFHKTPLSDPQRSVLSARLLRDATDPNVPVEPPIASAENSNPAAQQTPADTTQQPSEVTQVPVSTPVVAATPIDPGTPGIGQAVTDFVEENH